MGLSGSAAETMGDGMSSYNDAVAAMIVVAGGIVPEQPFIKIRDSADAALGEWVQKIITDFIWIDDDTINFFIGGF
jgi:hypothetical protein